MPVKLNLEFKENYPKKENPYPNLELATVAKRLGEPALASLQSGALVVYEAPSARRARRAAEMQRLAKVGRCLLLERDAFLHLQQARVLRQHSALAEKIAGFTIGANGILILDGLECEELRHRLEQKTEGSIFEPHPCVEKLNYAFHRAPERTYKLVMNRPKPLAIPTDEEREWSDKMERELSKAEKKKQKEIKHPDFPQKHFFQIPATYVPGKKFYLLDGKIGRVLPNGEWETSVKYLWKWVKDPKTGKKTKECYFNQPTLPVAEEPKEAVAASTNVAPIAKDEGVIYRVILDCALNQYLQYNLLGAKFTPFATKASRIFITATQKHELVLNEAERNELLGYIKPATNPQDEQQAARLRSILEQPICRGRG